MAAAAVAARDLPHPVSFEVAYPERLSRGLIFVKWLLVIPHVLAVWLLTYALYILTALAWFGVLFTGRYPKAFFEFTSGILRWQANAFAYAGLMRDEYPPFSWEQGPYPLALDIERMARQSRVRLFIRAFAIIPHFIVFWFLGLASFVTTVIAWFAILLSGRYPRGLFRFNVGVMRCWSRQQAYLFLLRDEYPPYGIGADARPGNEAVSAVVGLPVFVAYVAVQVALAPATAGSQTVVVPNIDRVAVTQPSGHTGTTRLTLLAVDALPNGIFADIVAVSVRAEQANFLPAIFDPGAIEVEACDGISYLPDGATDDVAFLWRGEERSTTTYHSVPEGERICAVHYVGPGGSIRFKFAPTIAD